jgi:hypothetical protein
MATCMSLFAPIVVVGPWLECGRGYAFFCFKMPFWRYFGKITVI